MASSTPSNATANTTANTKVSSADTSITQLQQQLTELRERNSTLEATEAERRRALEEAQALTHLGSWEWDVTGGTITWSDELYRIYGLKPQEREIGFEEFMGMIHVDDRERVQTIINTSYQTGQPFEFEHRILMPATGRQRTLMGMGKVITDASGQVLRMLGTSQDVTERKAAETALHQSDKRFRSVISATHDLIYDLDLQDHSMWFNEVLQTDYGYSKQAIQPTLDWWLSLMHPDEVEQLKDQFRALLQSRCTTWSGECRVLKADGNFALVRNRAFIVRDATGKPERVVGSCLDITEARQLERAKDEFISLVSHQLRTPLTIIRLYGNMLTDGIVGPLTKPQFSYVQKMTGASVRLIKLVGDILNISRMELNRIKIDAVPSDVNELIQGCLDELAPIIATKSTRVSFIPQPGLKRVPVDTTLFCEIVHNLVGNALRYGKAKDGSIVVSFTRGKRGYALKVTDDGQGIPAIDQAHVFERFYRAQNAAAVDSEGSGLGLYMVKLFTEAAGGKTRLKSIEGQGTTFTISLPPEGMVPTVIKPSS